MSWMIHHGDCLDVLATLPDQSIDAIVTDPPYGRPHTPAERIEPTEHFLAHVTALRYQERPPAGDGAELPDILDLL